MKPRFKLKLGQRVPCATMVEPEQLLLIHFISLDQIKELESIFKDWEITVFNWPLANKRFLREIAIIKNTPWLRLMRERIAPI